MEQIRNPKVRLLGGLVVLVIATGLLVAASIAFSLWPNNHTSPGVTIHGSGYVIDALGIPGQDYSIITITVPGE